MGTVGSGPSTPGQGASAGSSPIVFMGDVVHAGAGNAEEEWRVVYFLTATWGDAEDYDTDSQHLPWTLALNVLRNGALAQQLSFQYREYEPWANFVEDGLVKRAKAFCDELAKLTSKRDFAPYM